MTESQTRPRARISKIPFSILRRPPSITSFAEAQTPDAGEGRIVFRSSRRIGRPLFRVVPNLAA